MKRKSRLRRHLPIFALGLSVAVIGSAAFALLRSFLNAGSPHPQQVIQQIQLIRPPPPPPNQPPPPPPPPQVKIHIPTPEKAPPTPDRPAPQPLGLDAKGGAGSDAFGLVGRPGGQDIVGEGSGAIIWYAGVIKDAIQKQLESVPELRAASFTGEVALWLGDDGSIQKVEIAKSCGDTKIDRMVEEAVSRMGRLPQPPPADTPVPVTVGFRS